MADTVINSETGEVIETTALVAMPTEMAQSRAPEVVLREAQAAAAALTKVLAQKPKKVIVNDKQYLEFDDWQVLGRFYGVTAKVVDTNPINLNGVQGFEARAVALYRGQEISAAESMCMNDEDRWSKRPMFQLRSMAQTRACAKVLRNVLSFVPVMAGYAATPAEEMDGEMAPAARRGGAAAAKAGPTGYKRNRTGSGKTISEKQRAFLFAQIKDAGLDPKDVQAWVKHTLRVESSDKILMDDFQKVLHHVNPKKFTLDNDDAGGGKSPVKRSEPRHYEEPDVDVEPDDDSEASDREASLPYDDDRENG